MEKAHKRKLWKYQILIHECQQVARHAQNVPGDVGCQGFPGQSLWGALSRLGIRGSKNIGREAEAATRWQRVESSERIRGWADIDKTLVTGRPPDDS